MNRAIEVADGELAVLSKAEDAGSLDVGESGEGGARTAAALGVRCQQDGPDSPEPIANRGRQ